MDLANIRQIWAKIEGLFFGWVFLGVFLSKKAPLSINTVLDSSFLKNGTVSTLDVSPFSITFYRLKMMDMAGKITFSKIISLENNYASLRGTKQRRGIKVYPNSVSNVLNIEYMDSSRDYQVINLLGQQVMMGKPTKRLDVSALPQGTYMLKVGSEQAKFVKQ